MSLTATSSSALIPSDTATGVGDVLRRRMIGGTAVALGVRAGGAILVLLVQLLLARWMGASQFGTYALALSWLQVLSLVAKCGWDAASTRHVAEYSAREQWGLLASFRQRRDRIVLSMSLAICVLGVVALTLLRDRMEANLRCTLLAMLCGIPAIALLEIAAADLRARQLYVWATLPFEIVRPLLLLGCLSLLLATDFSWTSAVCAMIAWCVANAAVLLIVRAKTAHTFPHQPVAAAPALQREWWRTALPLWLVAACSMTMLQCDVLLLGLWASAEDVGVYNIAARMARVIPLGLMVLNGVGAPVLAQHFAQHSLVDLQRTARVLAWGAMLLTTPAALVVIVFGRQLLALFGDQFTDAYLPLVILAVGQLVNGLTGCAGQLLGMTGHQKAWARVMVTFSVLQVVLSALLIPWLGAIGAALASSVALVGWNLALASLSSLRLGINCTALGRVSSNRKAGGWR